MREYLLNEVECRLDTVAEYHAFIVSAFFCNLAYMQWQRLYILCLSSGNLDSHCLSFLVIAMDDTIAVLKGDKVKKSDLDNLEKMSDFTRDFLRYNTQSPRAQHR